MEIRLFAIGDIHGCFDSFRTLLEKKIQVRQSDKIILLGDYIDRGPHSKEVIDYIIDLQDRGFDIIPLLGNHEAMLLDAWSGAKNLRLWMNNGGAETLKSFEIRSLKDLSPKYLLFFDELSYYFEFGEYLFVHAGFNDESTNPFGDLNHMIWNSRQKYQHPLLKDKTIVHGHRPIPKTVCIENVNNGNKVIDLDTGCVYSDYPGLGILTGLELNTKSLYFV